MELLTIRAVRGDGDCHVVLRSRGEVARRFAEQQWHASQVLEVQTDPPVTITTAVETPTDATAKGCLNKRWITIHLDLERSPGYLGTAGPMFVIVMSFSTRYTWFRT